MRQVAPRIGASLALVVTTSVVSLHHHNKHHPAAAPSAGSIAGVVPLRGSRNHTRAALRPSRSRSSLRVARPAGGSGSLSDVTMYCATGDRNADGRWTQLGDVAVADRSILFGTRVLIDGNVYTVRDWIGWGSDFDIYGGSDAACETRALDFGRRRLRVVVER